MKGLLLEERIMLPIGTIFFPLRVATMRIERILKGIKLRNRQN